MKKKSLTIICLIACALAQPACSPPRENKAPGKKPVAVEILTLEARGLPLVVESVGRMNPRREVALAPEVAGVVSGYFAGKGDRVKKGSVLIEINPKDYHLALNQAMANRDAAESRLYATTKNFERLKVLLPRNVISSDSFEKSEAEYKASLAAVSQSKAAVEISLERLKKTRIISPFSGFAVSRDVETGMTVAPGPPVMTIADIESMLLLIHLPERDYVHLDKKDSVSVSLSVFPKMEFKAVVHRIGIKADERANTFPVEILVKNPGLKLKAGMSALARITVRTIPDALMIPQSSVIYRENRREVFVADPDGAASARVIKMGISREEMVHVSEGLMPG